MAVDLSHLAPHIAENLHFWRRPERLPQSKIWLEQDGFIIRDVTPDLDQFVLQYMTKNYLTEEPMCKALKVAEDPLAVAEQIYVWEKLVLIDRVSIVVLKKGTPGADLQIVTAENPPEIIAVNLLFVSTKSDSDLPDFNKVLKSEKLHLTFQTFFDTGSLVNVFERYGVDLYLDGAGMSVAPEWRGKGLGKMLLEARCNLCKEMEIPLTKTVFTAIQSQKVAVKSGFEFLDELIYADLEKENGDKRFPNMDPDQERIQLMALRI